MNENPILKRLSKGANEPLLLENVKQFLRIEHDDEDQLLLSMIMSVRETAENYLNQSLSLQTWSYTIFDIGKGETKLARGPAHSISTVVTKDNQGLSSTLDTHHYHLYQESNKVIWTKPPPHIKEITFTYQAGYQTAEDVPEMIKQGMLNHLASCYENRLSSYLMPASIYQFYQPYQEIIL